MSTHPADLVGFVDESEEWMVAWEPVGHVNPPPGSPETVTVLPEVESVTIERSLIFYLGPNHYPAGLYLPNGYDLEERPGDPGWKVVRARDAVSRQILTLWAVRTDEGPNNDGGEQVRILDP